MPAGCGLVWMRIFINHSFSIASQFAFNSSASMSRSLSTFHCLSFETAASSRSTLREPLSSLSAIPPSPSFASTSKPLCRPPTLPLTFSLSITRTLPSSPATSVSLLSKTRTDRSLLAKASNSSSGSLARRTRLSFPSPVSADQQISPYRLLKLPVLS